MGLGRLRVSRAPRRVLLIIGDGNDSSGETARAALADLQRKASASGIEVRAVVEPGGDPLATTIERAGIPTVDAHEVNLTQALADAMGGTILTPPKAVMVVFEAARRGLPQTSSPRSPRAFQRRSCRRTRGSARSRIRWCAAPNRRSSRPRASPRRSSAPRGPRGAKAATTLWRASPAWQPTSSRRRRPDKLLVVIGDGASTTRSSRAERRPWEISPRGHGRACDRLRAVTRECDRVGSIRGRTSSWVRATGRSCNPDRRGRRRRALAVS